MRQGSQHLYQYRTTVESDKGGKTRVVFYETAVVVFDEDEILLNTGGWWTVTTRVRMNQASRHFDLGYLVFTKAGKWYVEWAGKREPFSTEQVRLDRKTGKVTQVE